MAPTREHQESPATESDVESGTASLRQDPGGRTHYITVPIRPLSGDMSEEHLDRLTRYYTLYGLVFCVVGAIALVFPLVFGVAVKSLLAWLLVLGGAVTLLQFFLICGAPGSTAFLLLGLLHLAAGLWMLLRAAGSNSSLSFVIGAWFLGHGIFKILMAVQIRNVTTWPAVLISGFVSIILALVVVTLTPRMGIILIGVAFGGDLILSGISLLLVSLMAFLGKGHRAVKDAEAFKTPLLHGGGQAAASA